LTFHVYNTLSKQKEAFQSHEPGLVRMYNCGPTVYNRQHIGNYRSFLFADVLRRWLEYLGYEVKQVMNITDVGHLTDDEHDEGADKIEEQARKTGKDPWKISALHTQSFIEDLHALGALEPMERPRATDHIPEMVEIIKDLIKKGHAYQVGGDVYFDVTTFKPYGRLSGNRLEDLDAGARIAINADKRNPTDFALWKSDPHHLMKWDTDFGPDGFPGWHIECSAMSRKHLGDELDIHTGGEDNIFPHHECEIAQSESFTGKTFATYWMHAKFLQVDGGKMSKSLGNVYTLDDVSERSFNMRQLRFALIRGHYRQPLNFTWAIMDEVRAAVDNLDELVVLLRRVVAAASGGENAGEQDAAGLDLIESARSEFEAAMNDDLNLPRALAPLFRLRSQALEGRFGAPAATSGLEFLTRVNSVLGVMAMEEQTLAPEIEALIDARQRAKADKDWAKADEVRDTLAVMGIELQDTPEGVTWRRK
jgi:cysteinyl-tRNA synthetase